MLALTGLSQRKEPNPGVGVPIVIVAVIAGGIGVLDLIDVAQRVGDAEAESNLVEASPGIGLYVTILGAGCAFVGGRMLSLNRR